MNTLMRQIKESNFVNYCSSQIKLFSHRYKSRKVLSKISDELLLDIGITRSEANIEAGKHFWEGNIKTQLIKSAKANHETKTIAQI